MGSSQNACQILRQKERAGVFSRAHDFLSKAVRDIAKPVRRPHLLGAFWQSWLGLYPAANDPADRVVSAQL